MGTAAMHSHTYKSGTPAQQGRSARGERSSAPSAAACELPRRLEARRGAPARPPSLPTHAAPMCPPPCSWRLQLWRHAGLGRPRAAAGGAHHPQGRHLLAGCAQGATEDGRTAAQRHSMGRLRPASRHALARSHADVLAAALRRAAPLNTNTSLAASACTHSSAGVVLWEIATRRVPRRGDVEPPPPSADCPAGLSQLIADCLQLEPTARPTAQQALERLQAL